MQTENFIFHFTGKLNQSYVMKSEDGTAVYEAVCEKMSLFKATPYRFVDHTAVRESVKMIGHTTTNSVGFNNFSGAISSSFSVDKEDVWEVLSREGFGYTFRLKGLTICYDVTLNGQLAGTIECAGTGVMNPKYKDSKLGQIPANGIFKVSCCREDIPGFFMLCFAFSKTEIAMKQLHL